MKPIRNIWHTLRGILTIFNMTTTGFITGEATMRFWPTSGDQLQVARLVVCLALVMMAGLMTLLATERLANWYGKTFYPPKEM